jgi:hypothetical protein
MAIPPGPTYWHEIIAAGSALVGAIIGGGITFFLQRAQHKHEFEAKYHGWSLCGDSTRPPAASSSFTTST